MHQVITIKLDLSSISINTNLLIFKDMMDIGNSILKANVKRRKTRLEIEIKNQLASF